MCVYVQKSLYYLRMHVSFCCCFSHFICVGYFTQIILLACYIKYDTQQSQRQQAPHIDRFVRFWAYEMCAKRNVATAHYSTTAQSQTEPVSLVEHREHA